jgi:alkylation response protein AidB-like acyl-CoA dehydrogenase
MRTRAARDGDQWVQKNNQDVDHQRRVSQYYTVMAVTDPSRGARGISAFVVEKSDPGVSFGSPEKKLGIKGSPTRTVIFEDTRIPADRMIGADGTGFRTALATPDHTRVTIAAQALGIAQGALDYAVGYVKERRQFGRAIADFQGVQFMLADMAMNIEAARQLTYHATVLSEHAMNGAVRRPACCHGQTAPRRTRVIPRVIIGLALTAPRRCTGARSKGAAGRMNMARVNEPLDF